MKRIIILEFLLLFVLTVLISTNVFIWKEISDLIKWVSEIDDSSAAYTYETIYHKLPYGIFSLIACIADLIAIALIAIKDFCCFKRITDKLQVRKEKRNQVKAERAEAEKQKRIEMLKAELEELKKN